MLLVAAMATALGGLSMPSASAEGTIRTSPGAEVVADSYIVVLKDSVPATEITGKYGGVAGVGWDHALHGFVVTASESEARRIAADPKVDFVQQDTMVSLDATQNTAFGPGNLDHIDQRTGNFDGGYSYLGSAGRNVDAYIIDSGIRLSHTNFGGRARFGFNAVAGTDNTDCNGHGTHVAGITGGATWGVAKAVDLIAVKVFGCAGSSPTSTIISGVDWVTANAARPAVVNMSLGGGANAALDTAVRNSIATGLTYTLASGNGASDACNTSPARVTEAITVNSTNNADVRAATSNFGPCTDVFAPGVDITSTWNTTDTATNTIGGTSMAAPHAAGVAALYLQRHPNATPQQVGDAIIRNAGVGLITNPGTGSPNRRLYSRFTMAGPTGDYNDDQITEHVAWRPSTGAWHVLNHSSTAWGQAGDVPVPGDYNGDGVSDRAVWRPSTGTWHVFNQFSFAWGQPGDVPVPGDYNSDGTTDLAVWRPSTGAWHIHNISSIAWGQRGDIPVPGDFNGDGRTDHAVWRPSTGAWHVLNLSSTIWGQPGDVPVVTDLNGDGITDHTVWRPSTGAWHALNISSIAWGQPGDVPVPGDFNGDGRTEHAVWRPSTGAWHVRTLSNHLWGQPGDIPLSQ
ncbi:MAG: S8 family serine peptidase [Kibdelosporangium sp.]